MVNRLEAVILPTGHVFFEWTPTSGATEGASIETEQLLKSIFSKAPNKALLITGLISQSVVLTATLHFWRTFSNLFVKTLLTTSDIEEKREKINFPLTDEEKNYLIQSAPPMVGIEFLNFELLSTMWNNFHETFRKEITNYNGPVESLLRKLTPNHDLSNKIHFHLVENRKSKDYPFAFMATFSAEIDDHGSIRHVPLQFALKKFQDSNRKLLDLLSTVHKAAKNSTFIKNLLDSGELFQPISFDTQEAYVFLSEVYAYEEAGILCRIPRWWRGKPKKVSLGLSVGNTGSGKMGASSILDLKACLHIDGEVISEEEARQILEQYEGLAFFKGKWIAVDRELLAKTLTMFQEAKKCAEEHSITISDAMQMLMGTAKGIDERISNIDSIFVGNWLKSILGKMTNPTLVRSISPGRKVKASLRTYQKHGLNWLYFMHTLNFGMCLADDMGLGKTVQVLSLLQTLKEKHTSHFEASLLIVPASLMTNWQQEIQKFTPELKAIVAHPQSIGEIAFKNLPSDVSQWDLIITTYAMARKLAWLHDRKWFYIILDEAQAIKNSGTAQTKAIKKINGYHKLVMTGTPVENKLNDLWSLFDFINPGLLGTVKRFGTFIKKLEKNPNEYTKLRQVIHPYILRRLKTDHSIISDLPEKIEMKCYANLSKNQVILYKDLVSKFKQLLADSNGMKRRGLVLGYLMKLKQLCNHPDHFSGTGDYREDLSGKFTRLRDISQNVYEKREKMLVFTQFREIIKPLDIFLSSVFNNQGLTLSGATTVKKRKERIDLFQSDEYIPYFILSLKAGGVGLNLTQASHVIHFDRWWNPAVENQATDRAFRIGQKKNVLVHKFICKGTIEEKIDDMIEEKKSLSSKVIGSSSESWITELSNEKLIEMFKLHL